MKTRLQQTKRKFVIATTALATLSVLVMGFALYEANVIQFSGDLASQDLQEAVAEHPEVAAYLETEHQNEAHFLTIANIIKSDQQESLGHTMLWLTIPILVVAAAVGYLVSKFLLRPVEEAYEAQERFLADAAHELRNPLATMSAVVQSAEINKKADQQTFMKYMRQIRRQLSRMVRINEDLLYLERDVDDANDIDTPVSELLQDVIEDMQPHALDRKLSFDLSIEEELVSDINPKDFVRLAKNLIENAIKYSRPKSKKVTISLSNEKGKIKLVVADQGIGIPEEDLEHINDRFFRAGNVKDLPGSGLGLSIVNKVVEKRKGRFDIDSKVNKGTTISVVI